jgi:hypothetical protein
LHDFWGTKTQRITVVLGQNGAKQPVKFWNFSLSCCEDLL